MSSVIEFHDVDFFYPSESESAAVSGLSFCVEKGEHLVILGPNGSGKSTVAKLICGLEIPVRGYVLTMGVDTREDKAFTEARRHVGLVLQNPDNQIVATTVEEDVAFGPENLGVPTERIRELVSASLSYVGLKAYAKKMPSELSGGQKQKLAIAGIIAMKPELLILDEATSMLDPESRREFMKLVLRLRAERNISVVNITHNMNEVLLADRVIVMSQGKRVFNGAPSKLFDQYEMLQKYKLDMPVHSAITRRILSLLDCKADAEKIFDETACEKMLIRALRSSGENKLKRASEQLKDLISKKDEKHGRKTEGQCKKAPAALQSSASPIIEVKNLSYSYESEKTETLPEEKLTLKNISFNLIPGEIVGIMGRTGSGKSTLIQHLNGLIRSREGSVSVNGKKLEGKRNIKEARKHVALLFQYPEHQLFAETVRDDIAFGPEKLKLPEAEIEKRVLEAIDLVGLEPEILKRSPFELSGGQKRRVAIAGLVSMKAEVMILDEPCAGLDPEGRDEILSYAENIRSSGRSVIFVSHSMEDIARIADRTMVLAEGRKVVFGSTEEVFSDEAMLRECGLSLPAAAEFLKRFKKYFPNIKLSIFRSSEAALELIQNAAEEFYG